MAVLENGPSPRVMLRTDLDALPIIEEAGVSYASKIKSKNPAGQEVGVMHACGHDIHVTTLIGAARALASNRQNWPGTLLLIGQPSEETGDGAKAMLTDRLYERFRQSDLAVMLHETNMLAAGTVSVTSGYAMAGVNSVDVTLRGTGGHGAQPQSTKDPFVMSGEFIMQIQTIVSRQLKPGEPAVVTIGDIHGGTKRNIIPDEVKMELTVRAYSGQTMQTITDAIRRAAQSVALSAGVPEDRQPVVAINKEDATPAIYNDPDLNARVKLSLAVALGEKMFSMMNLCWRAMNSAIFPCQTIKFQLYYSGWVQWILLNFPTLKKQEQCYPTCTIAISSQRRNRHYVLELLQ